MGHHTKEALVEFYHYLRDMMETTINAAQGDHDALDTILEEYQGLPNSTLTNLVHKIGQAVQTDDQELTDALLNRLTDEDEARHCCQGD